MGKRSNYQRVARDCYDTPYDAVIPLLEHLSEKTAFIEPCAGKNALTGHLAQNGHNCLHASDIYPRDKNIAMQCVFEKPFHPEGLIITNPPWDRDILHRLIEKVVAEDRIAWLLFDADWCHTKQSIPFSIESSGENTFVVEVSNLEPGEYCFIYQGTFSNNSPWYSYYSNQNQSVFDFSIE